jgi:hypothetical protein
LAAGTLFAGCLGDGGDDNDDDSDNSNGNISETTTDEPAGNQTNQDSAGSDDSDTDDTDSSDDDTDSLAGPIELTEAVLTAASQENVARFRELLHPLNPVTNTPDEELTLGTLPESEPEITIETQDPSVATVYADVFRAERTFSTQESQLKKTLSDGAATVNVRLPDRDLLWVVVTDENDDWRLLLQSIPTESLEPAAFEIRVIDDVVFDAEAATARLKLLSEPTATELRVDSAVTTERFETVQDRQEPPTISIAEDGGELAVNSLRGDEAVPLHRERYGTQRIVADITVEQTEQERANRAQVNFTDPVEADEIGLATTRLGGAVTAAGGQASEDGSESTTAGIESLRIGVAPQYDEIRVTLTQDGDQTEVHRERVYYG